MCRFLVSGAVVRFALCIEMKKKVWKSGKKFSPSRLLVLFFKINVVVVKKYMKRRVKKVINVNKRTPK
jgi:hypothetical protein